MLDLFSMSFFQNAFYSGLILSVLFGTLSFFIVMNRMAFMGTGIAHTAFGGVALGIFLGISPFGTSLVFCILAALFIGRMVRYGRISYDTSIGIFFSFSMALGALLIALRKAYTFDLQGYLFGNILGVTSQDTLVAIILLLLFIPFLVAFFQKLLFISFDEDVAAVSGVPVAILNDLFLIFLAAIIVLSIKMVGIILVSALVVLPASFGLLISSNYRGVILVSVLYTLTIMMGGLFLSYYTDTPTGATIVTLGTAIYFLAIGMNRFLRPR